MQAGKRVTPEQLPKFCALHEFKAPGCLCASNAAGAEYSESDVYLAVDGDFWGEYVASCAADRCGYLGKSDSTSFYVQYSSDRIFLYLVGIERMYGKPDLLSKSYPARREL